MKISIFLIMILLLSVSVMAIPDVAQTNRDKMQENDYHPTGLEQAMLVVDEKSDNKVAMQVLEKNWERFRERNNETFNHCIDEISNQDKCDYLVVEDKKQGFNKVIVQEKVEMKFFGMTMLNGVAEERVVFDSDGKILKESKNFMRWIQTLRGKQ